MRHERCILMVHYVHETDIVRRTSALSLLLTDSQRELLRWQIIYPQGMFREGCVGGRNIVVIVIRQYVPLCVWVCVPVCHAVRFKMPSTLYKWTGSKIATLIDMHLRVEVPPCKTQSWKSVSGQRCKSVEQQVESGIHQCLMGFFLSFLAAAWRTHISTERWARAKRTRSQTTAQRVIIMSHYV